MPLIVDCPACRRTLQVTGHQAGQQVKCTACKTIFTIPQTLQPAHRPTGTGASPSAEEQPALSKGPLASHLPSDTVPPDAPSSVSGVPTEPSGAEHGRFDFLSSPQGAGELGRLGGYRILSVLGQGGMGIVFQAEDMQLQRLVALKVMQPTLAASPAARQRFLREARAAAAVEHDHVVAIHQVGEDKGIPFLAMPFLKGETLEDRLRRESPLPVGEVLRIGRECAEGLAAAHERGLIHRDIKPSNIWLEGRAGERGLSGGSRSRVKIVDFGLARAACEDTRLTQTGAVVGTPSYMAPEQAKGETVDARADLFSLGCVLYRLTTGTLPFPGSDAIAILWNLACTEPKPPHELNPQVPLVLSELVMRLLQKDPAKRIVSAQEVVAALETLERQGAPPAAARTVAIGVPGDGAADPTGPITSALVIDHAASERKAIASRERWPPRRRLLVSAAAAVALALLVVGAVVISWETPRGTVRIEVNEPDIKVTFDQDGPTITGADKDPITLKPGDHGIVVTRGDFTFETDKFVLKKGQTVTLKIEFREGKVKVDKDGKVFWEEEVPLAKPFTPATPLAGLAVLVPYPAPLPGVKSWTIVPRGHLGSVTLAAYSKDSQRLATGGRDGTVRLWDPAKIELKRILLGHSGPVTCLAWSPDGKTLASGSEDMTVRLWEPESGQLLRTLSGHQGTVRDLAWSPDGKSLASGGDDKSVRLWQGDFEKETYVFKEHKNKVTRVAWRPDGKTLVSYSTGNNLYCLWEAETGKVLSSHAGAGQWCWSPDYKVLALKTGKNTVDFWDADSDKVLRTLTLKELKTEIAGLAWSSDGKTLATGTGPARVIQLWDALTGAHLHTTSTEGHFRQSFGVKFSPDSAVVASDGDYDRVIPLWDVKTGKNLRNLAGLGHSGVPGFSPDGKTVWARSNTRADTQTLQFWVGTTDQRRDLQTYRPDNQNAVWSPDGKRLATVSTYHDGAAQVRLWDLESGRLLRVDLPTRRHTAPEQPVAWSPDGKVLATSFRDGVQLWNTSTGNPLRELADKPAGWVHALAWSPDGKMLVSFADEAWLWDAATVKPVRALTGAPTGMVRDLAWSPDGKILAAANRRWNHIDRWDTETGEHLPPLKGHRASVSALAWSPDGTMLASGSDDVTVRLWDSNGKFLINFEDRGEQGPVTALAWLPGRKLATLSSNSQLCIWDVDSGKLVRCAKTVRKTGRFSPDGRLLASTNDPAGVRLWETETGRVRGTLVFLQPQTPDQYFIVAGDGHYRGEPQRVIDREAVAYVVQTDRGQEMLTPGEFEKKYGWKNDPANVQLVRELNAAAANTK